jgi:hypothetical protein
VFTVGCGAVRRRRNRALHTPLVLPLLLAGGQRGMLASGVPVRKARLRSGYCAAPVGEQKSIDSWPNDSFGSA